MTNELTNQTELFHPHIITESHAVFQDAIQRAPWTEQVPLELVICSIAILALLLTRVEIVIGDLRQHKQRNAAAKAAN